MAVSMMQYERKPNAISLVIPSQLSTAADVLREAGAFFAEQGTTSPGVMIVLRELLMNAVVHGNRRDPYQHVYVDVEKCLDGIFRITVEDEGEGFDYRELDLALPEGASRIRERGYKLINAFSEKLEFNQEGNKITAFVRALNGV
ncbi:MAG TPA: ATP-binding protein [Candidatus Hydrogenedentes bacterium]|nr:ATP-binding protein [Candidatus Hydrogenedentota bacterium]